MRDGIAGICTSRDCWESRPYDAGLVDGGMDVDAGADGGPCGARLGDTCGPDEYCDHLDDQCGAADGTGTCTPRPTVCTTVDEPVCGCDGAAYANECRAYQARTDVSVFASCADSSTFGCGARLCTRAEQYCQLSVSDVAGIPDVYTCEPLPAACAISGADCTCFPTGTACRDLCGQDPDGNFRLTCPGG